MASPEPTTEVITIRHLLRTVPLALAAMLLAVSCGGGEDPAIDVPEGLPTDTETTPPAEVGDGGDLAKLAGAWAESAAKVTYDLTSGTTPTQTMTLYWKPPSSWRMDIGSDAGSTIIISTADAGYVCTGVPGASTCIESPADPSAQAPIPFAGLFTSPEGILDEIETQTGGADLEESSATIAGLDATCFAVSGGTGAGEIEWCFSEDGILLRYSVGAASTAATGQFAMEATEVDPRVSAADFEPPYPVSELPSGKG